MVYRKMLSASVYALAGLLAPAGASAMDLMMTTVLYNQTPIEVRGGVQNVEFKTIPATDGITVWPKIGVSLFQSTHAAYRADFEGMEGPHVHYCEVHIQTWAKHTFFGGFTATACQADVKHTMAGWRCEAGASQPSAGGCSFTLTLRK